MNANSTGDPPIISRPNPLPKSITKSANVVTGRAEVDYDLTRRPTWSMQAFSTGFKPGGGNIALAPLTPYEFKPETITAYEIGAKNAFMDNKISWFAAAFYYDYKDMQYEAEDLATYQGGVDNIPSAEIYGVEGEASFLLPYNLRLDTDLTVRRKARSHRISWRWIMSRALKQSRRQQHMA